mmetsp:Transcript_18199/g.21437  ORF Transcript_18199/g.21437 Transcript_18199/m.21437 type:complete len:83 (+) Transcript_18199:309-557(+)
MYPGWQCLNEVWGLLVQIYGHGWAPISSAYHEPEEEQVFYSVILLVFWMCFSTALFLFLVAGFANARNITKAFTYFLASQST